MIFSGYIVNASNREIKLCYLGDFGVEGGNWVEFGWRVGGI